MVAGICHREEISIEAEGAYERARNRDTIESDTISAL